MVYYWTNQLLSYHRLDDVDSTLFAPDDVLYLLKQFAQRISG